MDQTQAQSCECSHHMIIPSLVVLFALLFLLGSLGLVSQATVAIGWPIIVGVGGIMKLIERRCHCC